MLHPAADYNGSFDYPDSQDDHFDLTTIYNLLIAMATHSHEKLDGLGTPSGQVRSGTAAARPAAGSGRIYVATDTNVISFAIGGTWYSVVVSGLAAVFSVSNKFDVSQYIKQIATPAAPPAGYTSIYAKADGNLYSETPAGAEHVLGGIPTGVAVPYFGTVLPANTLWCDGHSEVVATYAALSAVIRPTFGGADGAHFYLPDLRSRMPMGADNFGAGAAGLTVEALGAANGEDTHVMTAGEAAALTYTSTDLGHAHNGHLYGGGGAGLQFLGDASGATIGDVPTAVASASITTTSNAGGAGHNNRPLALGCNWIVGV